MRRAKWRRCPTTRSCRPTRRAAAIASRCAPIAADPDGGLLGPLNATHFEVGDVAGPASRLVGRSDAAAASRSPTGHLFNPVAFDRTRFEGDLPAGWDAEIYRNGELLAFSRSDGSSAIDFDDVQLLYGDNRFEIVALWAAGAAAGRAAKSINVGQETGSGRARPGIGPGINQPGAICSAISSAAMTAEARRSTTTSGFRSSPTSGGVRSSMASTANLGRRARGHAAGWTTSG